MLATETRAAQLMAPAGSLCSQGGPTCAPPVAPPEQDCARPPLNAQHVLFLHNWQLVLGPKMEQLLSLLGQQEVARNLALAQVWTYIPVLLEGKQVLKAERACLLGDASLAEFHHTCAEEGVAVASLGPMGKVWEAGVVKVVQDVQNLAPGAHPCDRLHGSLGSRVTEVVYLPVYEPHSKVSGGVVAVLEVMVGCAAHDNMVLANVISTISRLMEALQLTLSNPLQQQDLPSPGVSPGKAAPAAGGGALSRNNSMARSNSMTRTASMRQLRCG